MGRSVKRRSSVTKKRSNIFSNEMRIFFCKYNGTLYVKMAKLDIMHHGSLVRCEQCRHVVERAERVHHPA